MIIRTISGGRNAGKVQKSTEELLNEMPPIDPVVKDCGNGMYQIGTNDFHVLCGLQVAEKFLEKLREAAKLL